MTAAATASTSQEEEHATLITARAELLAAGRLLFSFFLLPRVGL
jgi:hypothetical protein